MLYFKQQQNYAPDGWCLISWDAICHLSFFNHMSKRHSDVYHLSSNERLFHGENASITRKPHTIQTEPHMYANQLNASSAQRISRFDTPLDLSGKQKPYPTSQQHWRIQCATRVQLIAHRSGPVFSFHSRLPGMIATVGGTRNHKTLELPPTMWL